MRDDKNGKLIPEKGDLSPKTLAYVWDNAFSVTYAQAERRKITAERLKLIRATYKVTQKELCKKIGLLITTYSGYEQGKHDIPTEMIVRIAELFDISADYIIGITDNPKGKYAEQLDKEMARKVDMLTKLIDNIEGQTPR